MRNALLFMLCVWFELAILMCGLGSTRQMVCKDVDDDGVISELRRHQGPQGPPGKRGAQGVAGVEGPRGETGPPGTVDYGRINEHIDRAVEQATARLNEEVAQCQSKLAGLEKEAKRNVTLLQQGHCKVFHNGKCFAVLSPTIPVNLETAKAQCSTIGGKPGNIYSREHFEKVVDLIRSQIKIGWTWHHLWTGMTLNTQSRILLMADGTGAPFTQWFPRRPFASARPHVGIHINQTPSSAHQGMFDEVATYNLKGVLCEIEL